MQGTNVRRDRQIRDRHIIECFRDGLSYEELSSRFSLSVSRIRQIISLSPTMKRRDLIQEELGHVEALLRIGSTPQKIASELRVPVSTVYRRIALLRQNKNFDFLRGGCKMDVAAAQRLRAAGATLRTIAHLYGVSSQYVGKVLGGRQRLR